MLRDYDLTGGYRVEEPLGWGSTGVTYRGRTAAGEPVAIKLLMATADPPPLADLRRLVSGTGGHPGLIPVRDIQVVGGAVGSLALVAPLVPGPSLRRHVGEQGPLGPPALAALVTTVAGALAALHRAGFVHGGVHGGNILLPGAGSSRPLVPGYRDGQVPLPAHAGGSLPVAGAQAVLTDAGLAGWLADPACWGPASAPSPEGDTYGLALAAWQATTGHGVPSTARLGSGRRRVRLADLRPDLPAALVAGLEAALAARPEERPSAQELAVVAGRAVANEAPAARAWPIPAGTAPDRSEVATTQTVAGPLAGPPTPADGRSGNQQPGRRWTRAEWALLVGALSASCLALLVLLSGVR